MANGLAILAAKLSYRLQRFRLKHPKKISLTGALVGLPSGFALAYFVSEKEDLEQYIPKFTTENEVIAKVDKTGRPAFLIYFVPGGSHFIQHRYAMQKMAKYTKDFADFYFVNYRENYDFAKNKVMSRTYAIDVVFPSQDRSSAGDHPVVPYTRRLDKIGMDKFLSDHKVVMKDSKMMSSIRRLFEQKAVAQD